MESVTTAEEEIEFYKRTEWSNIMTKLLITLYKELSPKVGRNKEFANYTKLYERIAKIMSEKGYVLTAAQVKAKWDSLTRSFRFTGKSKKQKVRKQKTCLYQEELHDIFKNHMDPEVSTYPEIEVEETQVFPKMEVEESTSTVDEIKQEVEDPYEEDIQKKPKTPLSSVLRNLITQHERHHREKMALLKKIMKQKKEIAEQRTRDKRELLDFLKEKGSL